MKPVFQDCAPVVCSNNFFLCPLTTSLDLRKDEDSESDQEANFFQISHTFASITALFFLHAKKLSDVTVMSVKKALTQLGVTVPKGQSYDKESLVILLGKELFG